MNHKILLSLTSALFLLFSLSIQSQTQDGVIQEINDLFRKSYQPGVPFDSVFKNTEKIIELSQVHQLPVFKVRAYALLGTVKSRNKEFEKSMQYYFKAKNLAQENKDNQSYYGILQNIASNHLKTSYHDSALFYFNKVKSFYKNNNQKHSLNLVYMNIGNSFYYMNKLDSALIYLKRSSIGFLSTRNKVENASGIPSNRIVANNLLRIGDIYWLQKDYSKAIMFADSSLVLARQLDFKPVMKQNYNLLARSYKELGKIDQSSRYFQLESSIQLPTISPKNAFSIQNRNATSAVLKNKETQERLYKEYSKNKFYESGLFLSFFIIIILGIFVYVMIRNKKKVSEDFRKLESELIEIQSNKNTVKKPANMITLKSKAVVNVDDILYIKADDKYVEYYLVDKLHPEVDRNTLTEAEQTLPKNIFVKVHRSFIVNIYKIKILNSSKVMLENGVWINLSRTYKTNLKELLTQEVNY